MYFDEPVREFLAVPNELNIIMAISGFLVITYYFTVGSPLAGCGSYCRRKPALGEWLFARAQGARGRISAARL